VGAPGPTVGSRSVTLHWRLSLLTLLYTSTSSPIQTTYTTSQHYCLYTYAAVSWAASHLTAPALPPHALQTDPGIYQSCIIGISRLYHLTYVRQTLVYAAQATIRGATIQVFVAVHGYTAWPVIATVTATQPIKLANRKIDNLAITCIRITTFFNLRYHNVLARSIHVLASST
jgi:hypothetical protein